MNHGLKTFLAICTSALFKYMHSDVYKFVRSLKLTIFFIVKGNTDLKKSLS